MKKHYYYVQTDVPLDANGNPTGVEAPNTEESVVSGALLYLFFGNRFLIDEDGFVRRLQDNEVVDIPLQDAIGFHPKHSCGKLLRLVYIRKLFEKNPEEAREEERSFLFFGTEFTSKRKLLFTTEKGRIKILTHD